MSEANADKKFVDQSRVRIVERNGKGREKKSKHWGEFDERNMEVPETQISETSPMHGAGGVCSVRATRDQSRHCCVYSVSVAPSQSLASQPQTLHLVYNRANRHVTGLRLHSSTSAESAPRSRTSLDTYFVTPYLTGPPRDSASTVRTGFPSPEVVDRRGYGGASCSLVLLEYVQAGYVL